MAAGDVDRRSLGEQVGAESIEARHGRRPPHADGREFGDVLLDASRSRPVQPATISVSMPALRAAPAMSKSSRCTDAPGAALRRAVQQGQNVGRHRRSNRVNP